MRDAKAFQIGSTRSIKQTDDEKLVWDVRLNWKKPIFAGLIAVTIVAFFEYSRLSAKNNVFFLIGGIGFFLNTLLAVLLTRDGDKKRSKILNLMIIDVLFVVLFGVLGLTLTIIGNWIGIHVVHIWKAILFMSTISQLSLPVLTAADESIDLYTTENHILLGSVFMALASSVYLILSRQAWYLAIFAFLVVSLGTCVACLVWQTREYLIVRIKNISQNQLEVPRVLIVESVGLLISVVVGAIRLNVSTREFLWVLGISGGIFNLAFLILAFLVHPQPQKRRKLLLQTIGLILLGEAILHIFKQSLELFLASPVTFQPLSLAQWLPIIYLLFLILKDGINDSSSAVNTLPGILTGTIGLVFGLTWCLFIPLMYIYCLQGLFYGFLAYLVLPLVQQFIEQLRQRFTNVLLPSELHPRDNQRKREPDNRARISKSPRELPLVQTFRFIHEPLGANVTNRFVGRQDEIEYLANRIQLSTGGAFLITGYRGVGKTSSLLCRKLHT